MTPPLFTLRPANPADTAAVLRLIRGLATYERLTQECTAIETDIHNALFGPTPCAHAILADVGNQSVGLALFYYTFSTFKARSNIFLEDLYVEPEHRGSGIGLALIRALARRAVTEDCPRIEWRVLDWNKPSIDFYERLGAKPMQDWHTRQLGGEALVALAKGSTHG